MRKLGIKSLALFALITASSAFTSRSHAAGSNSGVIHFGNYFECTSAGPFEGLRKLRAKSIGNNAYAVSISINDKVLFNKNMQLSYTEYGAYVLTQIDSNGRYYIGIQKHTQGDKAIVAEEVNKTQETGLVDRTGLTRNLFSKEMGMLYCSGLR